MSTLEHQQGRASRPTLALHVINGRFFGGGHRSTLMLMNALDRDQDVTTELCTLGEGGDLPLKGRQPIMVEYNGQYNDPRMLWSAAQRLRAVLDSRAPDIVHTHGLDADLIGMLAIRSGVTRHVCHLRITPPKGRRESWKAKLRRRLFRYLTHRRQSWFIAVSEAVRQEMAMYYGLPLHRIITVRNGVDLSEFRAEHPGVQANANGLTIIGTAGRLEPMKGFEHLIAALSQVQSRGLQLQLRIAGTGSERDALQRQADSLGIGQNITFVGHVRDMAAFYSGLDVFVLPSVSTEGLPLVLLEAMSMGVAVVATRLAGAPEVIDNDVTGLLVSPEDPNALADAIWRVATTGDLRQRMAASGASHVRENFSVERVAAEVMQVYTQALADSQ